LKASASASTCNRDDTKTTKIREDDNLATSVFFVSLRVFAVILNVCVPRGLSLGESDRRAGATKLRNESNVFVRS